MTVNVVALADNVVEASNETVTMTITPSSTYVLAGAASSITGTVTIIDDAPVVEVSAEAVREGEAGVGFTFTRSGGLLSSALTVSYSVGGTATSGSDYTALSGSVAFGAGITVVTVAIDAIADLITDANETVSASLTSTSSYLAGADDSANATIVDNTAITFTLNGDSGAVWFTIPWDTVDPYLSSQSVAVTGFALVFAGRTFDDSNTTFAMSPVAMISSNQFTGIAFSITGITSFGYTSVSAGMSGTDNVLSAIQTGTSQLFQVVLADTVPETVLYFHQAIDRTKDDNFIATRLRIRLVSEGVPFQTYTYEPEMVGGETVGDVANMVYNNLKTAKWKVELLPSQKGVIVYGKLDLGGALLKVTKSGMKVEGGAQGKVARRSVETLNYVNGNWE